MTDLQTINAWDDAAACRAFLRCCGSARWAQAMSERRPFPSTAAMLTAAATTWQGLARADWLEAFAAHPRIGDFDALRRKFASTASWAFAEQAGVSGGSESVLQALAEGNRRYEERFGYIFIVCATGQTADAMLATLRQRLTNDPDRELMVAAAEQEKITRLRLEKL